MNIASLTDEALLSSLHALHAENRRLIARMVVHLVEVEERSLHLTLACTSMFDFCVRKLRMSEGAAHRRLNAARLVRRFPCVLGRIERGDVHLSALAILAKHLTEANVEELMAAVAGKSLRAVETFLAHYAPRPDVPACISKVPSASPLTVLGAAYAHVAERRSTAPRPIAPLSKDRYLLQLTAGTELRDKIERARDLMRHRNPSGDLAVVVDRALDALLATLEKERLGKGSRPRRVRASGERTRGRIARTVRREVFERDGEQCTSWSPDGERCPSRTLLELDHIESRALGGSAEADHLRVRCRAHNRLHAERVFGRDHVARRIDLRRRKSQGVEPDVTARCPEPFDQALRGLANMGFAKAEAARALSDVALGRAPEDEAPWSTADLVREAIGILT